MKKATTAILLFCVVFSLLLTLLGGCGKTANSSSATSNVEQPTAAPGNPTNQPAVEATAEPSEDAIVPTEEYFPLAENDTLSLAWALAPVLNGIVNTSSELPVFKLLEEKTNISIEFTDVSFMTGAEQYSLMAVSGEYPDMLVGLGNFYSGGVAAAYSDDMIIDMTQYIQEDMPCLKAYLDSNDYWKDVKTDEGRILQMNYFTSPERKVEGGMVIRQDWLDQLSLDIPVTLDDYYNVLSAFKAELGTTKTFWISSSGVSGDNIANTNGVYINPSKKPFYLSSETGKVVFGPAEDGFTNYCTTLNTWYNDGLIDKDFLSTADNAMAGGSYISDDVLGENQTGVFYASCTTFSSYEAKLQAIDSAAKLTGISDALLQAGDKLGIYDSDQINGPAMGFGISISSLCKNPELAARWMDYWHTDEGKLITNYGVENESWEYGDNGKPQFTDLVLNNPDMAQNIAMSYWCIYFGPIEQDANRSYGTLADDALAAMDTWSSNRFITSAIPPMISMTTDESATFSGIWADISTYYAENLVKFIVGDRPLAEIEAFQDTLYQQGLQDCIDCYQNAYDRYCQRG